MSARELADIKGVIFDCDGVLVDSMDANRMYYNEVREKLGMLPMTPSEEEFVHAHAVNPSLAHIIPPERLDEAKAAMRGIKYAQMLPHTHLQGGLVEFLDALRGLEIRLAVNTNRTDSMGALLEYFSLTGYFDPVITAFDVSHPKPNPEGMHKILRAWDVTRFEVVYIGDTIVDEQAARGAGVPFWAYKSPKLTALRHVTSFDALRGMFQAGLGQGR